MEVNFVLPLPISVNALYQNQWAWNPKKKMRLPTGKRILTPEGEKLKKKIMYDAIDQLEGQEWDYEWTKDNFMYMDTIIYMNKAGRDDDNIYKLLKDSLQKIVYDNDSRVLVRTQHLMIDSENPRVKVKISPTQFIGIFEDREQLELFEEKCQGCSRYLKGRCGILKKSKEGRIQAEIDDFLTCLEFKPKKK